MAAADGEDAFPSGRCIAHGRIGDVTGLDLLKTPARYSIRFGDVFAIHWDGHVEFGPGFTTEDEASRSFIEALGRAFGSR